jgi:hypothetical protein
VPKFNRFRAINALQEWLLILANRHLIQPFYLNHTNSSYSTRVSEIVFDLLLICLLDDDLVFADTNEHFIAN